MGTYNVLKTGIQCPRCHRFAEQEVDLHFGYTNEILELNLGDKYRWHLGKEFQNGGRPEKGNIDGEGYVVCKFCKRDYFAKVIVRNDVLKSVEFDPTKKPFLKD